MPSNDTPDKPTTTPQGSPPVQPPATTLHSRSVDTPFAEPRLPTSRSERDMRALLFEPEWYLQQNADVAKARLDPVQHYLDYGAAEGRNPNSLFDTNGYLTANADVRRSPLNPFLHFVLYGFREGRNPSPSLKASSINKVEMAAPREMIAPASPEPPTEEKLRQTLLDAMFAAAAEVGGNDNRKDNVPIVPEKDPVKPSPRSRPGARRKP